MSRLNCCAGCILLAAALLVLAGSAAGQAPQASARPEARSQESASPSTREPASVLELFHPQQHADGQRLAGVLREALQARNVEVSADPVTGAVHLVGPPRELDRIRPLLRLFARREERATEPDVVQMRVFELRHVAAEEARETLQKLLPQPANVAADARLNSLIVATTSQQLQLVADVLRVLDVTAGPKPDRPGVKIFTLQRAGAAAAAEVLRSLTDAARRPGDGTVAIGVDDRTNAVIARGSEEQLATIEAVLLRLDQSAAVEEERRSIVVRLKEIPSSEASRALEKISLRNLIVVDEPISNSIILNGSTAAIEEAQALLEKLEVSSEPLRLRVVWLVHPKLVGPDGPAPPADLANVLQVLKEKTGVGELRMAAQFLVNSEAGFGGGSVFQFQGTASVRSLPTDVAVDGTVRPRTGHSALLEISIRVGGTLGRINTTISAPPGHPVVVGMTPIDSLESVFVIELLAEDGAAEPAARGAEGGGANRR